MGHLSLRKEERKSKSRGKSRGKSSSSSKGGGVYRVPSSERRYPTLGKPENHRLTSAFGWGGIC